MPECFATKWLNVVCCGALHAPVHAKQPRPVAMQQTCIDLEDEEEAAAAIVNGLRQALKAEREAHAASKAAYGRLQKQLKPPAQPAKALGYYSAVKLVQVVLPLGLNIGDRMRCVLKGVAEEFSFAFPADGVSGGSHIFRLHTPLQRWIDCTPEELVAHQQALVGGLAAQAGPAGRVGTAEELVAHQQALVGGLAAQGAPQQVPEGAEKHAAKEREAAAGCEAEVRKCVEMLVARTVRTVPKEYRYPPGEWDATMGRPVYHRGCFVNSSLFQMGRRAYVGVNIEHSADAEGGRRRQNHQVYFASVAEAQAYHASLPELARCDNDVLYAAKREREEQKKASDAAKREREGQKKAGDAAKRELEAKTKARDAARHAAASGPAKRPGGAAVAVAARAKVRRTGTNGSPPAAQASCFKGVLWDRKKRAWVARSGTARVESATELGAAVEYDKISSPTRTNFLAGDEAKRGHVRVMADGHTGTFAIYANSSGPDTAPVQLPREVLRDHAWHFTGALPLADRMRFHAPGLPGKLGRRVRIDGIKVPTGNGPRFVRFNGYLDSASTMVLHVAM